MTPRLWGLVTLWEVLGKTALFSFHVGSLKHAAATGLALHTVWHLIWSPPEKKEWWGPNGKVGAMLVSRHLEGKNA